MVFGGGGVAFIFIKSFVTSLYLIKVHYLLAAARSVHISRDDGLQELVPAWLMEVKNIS